MKFEINTKSVKVVDNFTSVPSVIRKITESDIEDSFYVLDIGDVMRKYTEWHNVLPRVHPHYAVKCNDHIFVLKTLNALGCNFDCASKAEISKVLALGVRPERIIFAHPTKLISHIKYAAKVGVNLMTFDNEVELHKIQKYHPNAKMVLRIKYDDTRAKYPMGNKFGCDSKLEAAELLKTALSLNINVVGVSFHVGSSSQDPSVFEKAIGEAKYVFNVAASLGFRFRLLDIGGGYAGEHGTSIKETANYINKALCEHFNDSSVQIISEPGRYFVSSAFTLAANVHSLKTIKNKKEETKIYYINAGVYGGLINILFDDKYWPTLVAPKLNTKMYSTVIFGPTCDGTDKVVENIKMPELKIGDWIYFEDNGAYSTCLATEFNGFPLPEVYALVSENNWKRLQEHFNV